MIRTEHQNEIMTKLIRSNLTMHMNKVLTQELIAQITEQIIESIDFVSSNKDWVNASWGC